MGDRSKVSLWNDAWVGDLGLNDHVIANISNEWMNFKVKDGVRVDGSWNVDMFEKVLPRNIILRIVAIHPPILDVVEDTPF